RRNLTSRDWPGQQAGYRVDVSQSTWLKGHE
ncbi:MAG: hypothetical protein ACI90Z_002162, partial [Cyanobium sp.]